MSDKPLSDKEEKSPSTKADVEGKAAPFGQPDFSKASVGAYNSAEPKPWDTACRPWNSTPQGRLAIRSISRGVLGAAFFAAGGLLNERWMKGYDATKPWLEQSQKNPLNLIAKLIDTGVGKPIKWSVEALGHDGARAVRFRQTKYAHSQHPGGGHSLGEEVVGVTFDFFSMSVGDAWGRDIIGLIDPNIRNNPDPHVRQKWLDDKGHVKPTEAVQSMLKSVWRYVSYNGGEDWAVAIPYVYFLRGHRAALNHFSPGFRVASDRGTNGGDTKINSTGSITGSYHQEGMTDLQHRFVVYNMGTLAYRELYDYVGKKLHGQNAVLYGDPDPAHHRHKNLVEKTADVFKWLARSVVKGGIYMTPAVPFFWITRTPQTKYRSTFINPKYGVLAYEHPETKEISIVHANERIRNPKHFGERTPLFWVRFNDEKRAYEKVGKADFSPGRTGLGMDPHVVYRKPRDLLDKILNPIGLASYHAAEYAAGKPAEWMDKHLEGWGGGRFKKFIGRENFSEFNRRTVHASISYTPYMYAKAEAANLWDDGKMDLATERLIDGASHFNWGEFKAGAGEVWRSFLHKPLADPRREAEAQHRVEMDTSAADSVNLGDADVRASKPKSNWRERVIAGKKPDIGADKPKSYAQQEEMRKALEELHPPTNSVN